MARIFTEKRSDLQFDAMNRTVFTIRSDVLSVLISVIRGENYFEPTQIRCCGVRKKRRPWEIAGEA